MCALLVLGLVFAVSSQQIGSGNHIRNDLFCVEWGVEPQLND